MLEKGWEQAADGLVAVRLDAEVPRARWDRPGHECGLVQLWLDGAHHQDVVLVRGEERATYERLLGRLAPGRHTVSVALAPDAAPPLPPAQVHGLDIVPLTPADRWETFAWEHAPVLWTRGEDGPWESLETDTPLAVFYRPRGDGVEFQCIFSHEDAGTDTRGLLAQWGRTTDIEWILALGADGTATYQGPGHRTLRHNGRRDLGRLALSVVGRHGMVSDAPPRGAMRCLFLPRFRWDPALPRETAMEDWMYRVTALELSRQGRLPAASGSRPPSPMDLRQYLFVQVRRRDVEAPSVPLDIQIMGGDGQWYRSSGGDWGQAVARPSAWSTTVRVGAGIAPKAIMAVAQRPLRHGRIELALHRAFWLDANLEPGPSAAPSGPDVTLTAGADRVTLWSASADQDGRAGDLDTARGLDRAQGPLAGLGQDLGGT